MQIKSLEQLIEGYREFLLEYAHEDNAEYRARAEIGQHPRFMVITCSDSRVNPVKITNSELGEMFIVSNVANLVPPYFESNNTHHSTSSALEYAVNVLQVEHVIVLGHSNCGGIRALMSGTTSSSSDCPEYSFIPKWMNIVHQAKQSTLEKHPNVDFDEQCSICEREALLVSLRNLKTFPWVTRAIDNRGLRIHAWYFDVSSGCIEFYDEGQGRFSAL